MKQNKQTNKEVSQPCAVPPGAAWPCLLGVQAWEKCSALSAAELLQSSFLPGLLATGLRAREDKAHVLAPMRSCRGAEEPSQTHPALPLRFEGGRC